MDDDDALWNVLDQHWTHLRHVEQLRSSFTNIYVVIVAGLLAVAVRDGGPQAEYTAAFLTFLSVVGIVINVKLGLEFYHRMIYVFALSERLGVEREMGRPLGMYGDDQQSGLAVLREWERWLEFVFDPSSAKTSEVVSPGHWVLLLHVVGFGVSLGWFAVALLGLGFVPGASVVVVATLVALGVIYTYTHGKFERIDELVERRVSRPALTTEEDDESESGDPEKVGVGYSKSS